MAKLSALTKNTLGLNSGVEMLSERILIDKINISKVFETLIPINESDLVNLTDDMQQRGFDPLHPVCIWREENILIDGHTRRQAAILAGLKEIYCYRKSFITEQEAISYAIQEQLRRRNLDDGGKIILIEKLDNLKKKGRPISNSQSPPKGKSSQILAETLGVSASTIERARKILRVADEETKRAVKNGEMTINKAYSKLNQNNTASKHRTLFQNIKGMELSQLAVYLNSIQCCTLSVSEWEERLHEEKLLKL